MSAQQAKGSLIEMCVQVLCQYDFMTGEAILKLISLAEKNNKCDDLWQFVPGLSNGNARQQTKSSDKNYCPANNY